mmetsp:Transcript_109262/g.352749  ORF Transcript_109262/g.352749 Transcript_109262/m.352749 type:complete len:214 (+) Transcript_109262:516-1157(+)
MFCTPSCKLCHGQGLLELFLLGEDALRTRALEVGNTQNGSIMHAVRPKHLDANPLSGPKPHLANVAHNALLALPNDLLAQPNTAIGALLPGRQRLDLGVFRCHPCHGCRCTSLGRGCTAAREACRLGKDSLASRALEVGHTQNAAVMHAFAIRQLEAQPLPFREPHVADVAHHRGLAVPHDPLPQRNGTVGSLLLGRKGLGLIFTRRCCRGCR